MSAAGPPEGFAPHFRKSPVTDPWEPLYSRKTDGVVQLGLQIRQAHCNSRGLPHGGVIAALADNAMGLSCAAALPSSGGLVTVSLSIDYLGSSRLGQWLQFEPRVLRRTLEVRGLTATSSLDHHNVLSFEVRGQLWSVPYPLEILLRSNLDLESGQVVLLEQSTPAA